MDYHEFDPTPPEPSPATRFYRDLETVAGNYVDLQISAQRLVAAELAMPEHGLSQLYGSILPTYELHSTNRRRAMEMFMVFPLELLGPVVELTRSAAAVAQWYGDAADRITSLTRREHTDACFALTPDGPDQCYASERCPRKILARSLVPGRTADFDSDEYAIDAYAVRDATLAKLEVARQRAILPNNECLVMYSNYDWDFEKRFGSVAQPGENAS